MLSVEQGIFTLLEPIIKTCSSDNVEKVTNILTYSKLEAFYTCVLLLTRAYPMMIIVDAGISPTVDCPMNITATTW